MNTDSLDRLIRYMSNPDNVQRAAEEARQIAIVSEAQAISDIHRMNLELRRYRDYS